MSKRKSSEDQERKFNENLVEHYLKYGSVDEVLRKNRFSIPISYAGFQRVLDKWGVIKAAGPNGKLSEIVDFMAHLAKDNIAIEDLYKKMPPSFRTSAATLYRVLGYIKEGLTRRIGTALVLTPYDSRERILIGKDISTPRIELGKPYGSLSLPMGYSSKADSRHDKILRVLQQEVFVNEAIKNALPLEIVPDDPTPFMYLDIADVRVAIFTIQLPKKFSSRNVFSSFKLKDFMFMSVDEMIHSKSENNYFRVGVREAVIGYKKYLDLMNKKLVTNPFQIRSKINKELATLTIEVE